RRRGGRRYSLLSFCSCRCLSILSNRCEIGRKSKASSSSIDVSGCSFRIESNSLNCCESLICASEIPKSASNIFCSSGCKTLLLRGELCCAVLRPCGAKIAQHDGQRQGCRWCLVGLDQAALNPFELGQCLGFFRCRH